MTYPGRRLLACAALSASLLLSPAIATRAEASPDLPAPSSRVRGQQPPTSAAQPTTPEAPTTAASASEPPASLALLPRVGNGKNSMYDAASTFPAVMAASEATPAPRRLARHHGVKLGDGGSRVLGDDRYRLVAL